MLLTHADLADRQRYLNARSTLRTLLELGVIPVINENDTVVTDEIKFGDNDTLGALVTNLVEADALVILTDQAGLFDADPRTNPDATLVEEADALDPALEAHGRRHRQRARQGRHAHQGAGGAPRRAQRRAHRHRLRAASPTCSCASPQGERIGTPAHRARPCRSPRASNGSPITSASPARLRLDAGAVQRPARATARACCRSAWSR